VLALTFGATGCLHVYEPLSGLNRPIVIDTDLANFPDLSLDIFCPPGDLLTPAQANELCRKVGILFENQGAQVRTSSRDRRLQEMEGGGDIVETGTSNTPRPIQLILELRARELNRQSDTLSWLFCYMTATLVPGVSESTFAQDVTIRDESGFLLLSDTLKGRIVSRFGLGPWAGNKLLDLMRKEDEKLSGNVANRELSADLYQQLSQLVFNAARRAAVLNEGTAVPKAAP
jgi:hypothetical protein